MSEQLSEEEVTMLLQHDLSTFIYQCFKELNPNTEYLHNWHIDLIASKLTEVMQGKCKRLVLNMPPRSLKSIASSISFVAWVLGHYPTKRIICASYGLDLSRKLALDCRKILHAGWYQRTFPQTRLSKNSVEDFETTLGGGRLSTSTGGALTGRGGDIIIVDDPLQPDMAISDVQRNACNDWFDNTLLSRLDSKADGAIVILMQRIHLDDLTGHIMEKGGWTVISLPAIAQQDTLHAFNTPFGPISVTHKANEALHPEREPLEILNQQRFNSGEYNFSAQYLQSPVPMGGGHIKTKWLQYLEPEDFPVTYDQIVQSYDTASKTSELADFSVCTTWGVKNQNYYLIDVWRKRVDFPALRDAIAEQYIKHKPDLILIEDASSGIALIQELRAAQVHCIKQVKPEGSKDMRVLKQSILFENGAVKLPNKAPWLVEYVHELTSFPNAKFDDMVDSTFQALAYLKTDMKQWGMFEYYRREHEKKLKKEAELYQ